MTGNIESPKLKSESMHASGQPLAIVRIWKRSKIDDAVEPAEEETQNPAALTVKSTVTDPEHRPDLTSITSVVIRKGPRHRVEARLTVIRNRKTKSDHHHDALTIETIRTTAGKDSFDPRHSVTLSSDDGLDEIEKLIEFVTIARGGDVTRQSGRYVAVRTPNDSEQEAALQEILGRLQATGDYKAFAQVLEGVGQDPEFLKALMDRAAKHPRLFAEAAAAINLAAYTNAMEQLKKCVRENETSESTFQSLLADNPWMFGSEL